MKHDRAFFVCLLGTLPLGCALGKYDSDWNKNGGTVGGNGATVGGGTNSSQATGGSIVSGTTAPTMGGSTLISSSGGNANIGGTVPSVGGGTNTGGSSTDNAGGAINVGGISTAGGTLSSGGTLGSVGGNLATGATPATGGLSAFGGNGTTSLVQTGGTTAGATTGGANTGTGGAAPTSGGANGGGSIGTGGVPTTGGTSGGLWLAKAIATGAGHTCALLTDGSVYCWGNNCEGELGDGSASKDCGTEVPEDMPKSATPVRVQGLSAVTALACGYTHSCAIAGGNVYCWGEGGDGQLGNGSSGSGYMSSTPVAVAGITNAKALAAGDRFTCALLDDTTVSCWGFNGQWELGNGTVLNSSIPVKVLTDTVPVVPLAQVSGIAAGTTHACAALTDGSGWCWGFSSFGQLGQGTNDDEPRAAKTLFSNVAEMAASYVNSCALMRDGTIGCVGGGYDGQLGDGAAGASAFSPVSPNPSLPVEVEAIALGASYTCAVLRGDRSVMCWGANWAGQLGDGTDQQRNSPTAVKSISGVFSISAKYAHTCALVGQGTAYCWGLTHYGQLGHGGTDYMTAIPVKVAGF